MYTRSLGLGAVLLSVLSSAQNTLDKPPLTDDLVYLHQGLIDNLPINTYTMDQWIEGWIPQDCKSMTEEAGLNTADIQTFNVHFDDCNDDWIVCWHTGSAITLQNFVDTFARLPVNTRGYVRHIISLPDSSAWGYNSEGNIAMMGDVAVDNPAAFIHEAGHSLDHLNGYMPDQELSSSQNWLDNYNQDTNVPNNYAQTNQQENVAENTIVDTFNLVVPGGFGMVQPNWGAIFHQYATIDTKQREGGNLLVPGGTCAHRLENSEAIQLGGSSRIKVRLLREKPNVELSKDVRVIPRKKFHTRDICALTKRQFGAGKH
ncbi:MAG: hypothetical protein LQ342_007508 [Letrouitia transgressa]|nr:MAG: hypothetical protein LQ342_007508 [Letrouitia transgressa]